jgi:hypothetical protein
MKHILSVLKFLAAFVFLAWIAACASPGQGTRDMAVAAGFQVITPTTAEQKALLPTLPEGRITQIDHDGKIFYVLPDVANNQAYVGGPAQYQAFQQLRIARQISNDNLAAAQMNQMNQMNWGMWGGWGAPAWRGPGGFGY